MSPPGNGIFVVRGEISTLMTAMRRGVRWSSISYHVCKSPYLTNTLSVIKYV